MLKKKKKKIFRENDDYYEVGDNSVVLKKTEMKLTKLFGVVIYCPNLLSYAQCYSTFYGPNLRMFIIR